MNIEEDYEQVNYSPSMPSSSTYKLNSPNPSSIPVSTSGSITPTPTYNQNRAMMNMNPVSNSLNSSQFSMSSPYLGSNPTSPNPTYHVNPMNKLPMSPAAASSMVFSPKSSANLTVGSQGMTPVNNLTSSSSSALSPNPSSRSRSSSTTSTASYTFYDSSQAKSLVLSPKCMEGSNENDMPSPEAPKDALK